MTPLKKIAILLPPGLLAVVELFHPHGHHDAVYDVLVAQIDRWLIVHCLQLVLFPLTAWSVYCLSANDRGWLPRLCAITLGLYGIGYTAFDSIAGIGTGLLIQDLHAMTEAPGAPESFRSISSEIVQSFYHSNFVTQIAHLAIASAILGFAFTAIHLHRRGHHWFPILMLAGAGWGVTKTHAPPYGPITYGFVFAAVYAVLYCAPRGLGTIDPDKQQRD